MTEILLYSLSQCFCWQAGGLIVVDPSLVDMDDLLHALKHQRPGSINIVRADDIRAIRYLPIFFPLPEVFVESKP